MPSTELRSDDEMLAATCERARELRGRRFRRRALGASIAVVALVVASAVAVRSNADDAPTVYATEETEVPTTVAAAAPIPEGWSPMATSPLSGRAGAVAAWTGDEMLIWRGDGAFTDVCSSDGGVMRCGERAATDGASYDPATDSWQMIPPAPVAEDQGDQLTYEGVWTGAELVVWGGPDGTGAAYDPATDSWRTLPPAPLQARRSFSMVWTGAEVLVAGGLPPTTRGLPEGVSGFADAAAYDPVADRWRTLPAGPAGFDAAGVWCDGSLVLLDDLDDDAPGSAASAYRPDTDAWSALPAAPVSSVWGAVCADRSLVVVGADENQLSPAAAVLDPDAATWTNVAAPPLLPPAALSLTWTGSQVVALGSPMGTDALRLAVAAFDPGTGSWTSDPDPPLTARGGVAATWTGDALLVWGGAVFGGYTSEPLADGARYRAAVPGPPSTTAAAGPATTVASVDGTAPPMSAGQTTTSFPGEPASLPRSPAPDPGDEWRPGLR